jgi:hypothetical protein
MLARFLRLVWSFINAYSFVTNPVQYIFAAIITALVPYLMYAIAGVAGLVILFLFLGFLLFRFAKSAKS